MDRHGDGPPWVGVELHWVLVVAGGVVGDSSVSACFGKMAGQMIFPLSAESETALGLDRREGGADDRCPLLTCGRVPLSPRSTFERRLSVLCDGSDGRGREGTERNHTLWVAIEHCTPASRSPASRARESTPKYGS